VFEKDGNSKGIAKKHLPKIPAPVPQKSETAAERRKCEHDERIQDLKFQAEEAEALEKIRDAEQQLNPKHPKEYQKIAEDLMRGEAEIFAFTFLAGALRKHWKVGSESKGEISRTPCFEARVHSGQR